MGSVSQATTFSTSQAHFRRIDGISHREGRQVVVFGGRGKGIVDSVQLKVARLVT